MVAFYISVLIFGCVLIVIFFIGVNDLTRALPDPDDYKRLEQLHEQNRAYSSDALRTFILDYIDDKYGEFAPVRPTDRLVQDLGIDSLDLVTIMTDISYVTATDLQANEFMRQYGIRATVSDLIQYVRSKQPTLQPR